MLLGGSEISAHTAQSTSNLQDDGSTPIILTMLFFLVMFLVLFTLTRFTAIGAMFGSLGLTSAISIPFYIWRHRRRKRMLEALRKEQIKSLRDHRNQPSSRGEDPLV